MKRFILTFGAGIVATHIFYFFYYTAMTDKSTGYYIANAAYRALPFLIVIIAIAVAIVIIDWWLHSTVKSKQNVLDEAEAEAEAIKSKAKADATSIQNEAAWVKEDAKYEATRIITEASASKQQVDHELKQLEIQKQNLEAEFESKRQTYLVELEGLRRKNKVLAEELAAARKAGIKKMRAAGNEGGANRVAKKLEKQLAGLTSADQ